MKRFIKPLSVFGLFCLFTFGSVNEANAWKLFGKEESHQGYVGGRVKITTKTYFLGIRIKTEEEWKQL